MTKYEGELTEQEREIIECLFTAWANSDDMPLHGDKSYQDVIDLMTKLGIDHTTIMASIDTVPMRLLHQGHDGPTDPYENVPDKDPTLHRGINQHTDPTDPANR